MPSLLKQLSFVSDEPGKVVPSTCSSYLSAEQNRSAEDVTSTRRSQAKAPDTDDATTIGDTVHYLSPISPVSARTVHEGDEPFDYIHLFHTTTLMRLDESSSYKTSTISCIEPDLQRTVAIVKPDAMQYEDVIMRAVNESGFSVIDKRYIHFTPEQVSEFYSQYYGSPAFPHYVVSMSVGPVLAMSLAGLNAVAKWRDIVGPDRLIREEWFVPMSMRIRFGLREAIPNAVHASDNLMEANKENRYIYPDNILEPMLQELDKVKDYCGLYVNPTLLNGLTELVKVKPIDPILFLAEWLLLHNPFQPEFVKEIGLIPT